MLQATVQSNFKFLGKQRRSGDVISAKELSAAINAGHTTMVAVNALKNQKMIILQDEGEQNVDRSLALNSASMHAKLDAIIKHFNIEVPTMAAPAESAPKKTRKKAA